MTTTIIHIVLQKDLNMPWHFVPPRDLIYAACQIGVQLESPKGQVHDVGTGTGFVVTDNEGRPWVVTNRHVLDPDFRQPAAKYLGYKLCSIALFGRRDDGSVFDYVIDPAKGRMLVHENTENDVIIFEPWVISTNGDVLNQLGRYFTLEQLADEAYFRDELYPTDVVCTSGYPDPHDKLSRRPVMRTGAIASDPRYSYTWDKTDRGDVVAYDGFSLPGASGSPVFALGRGAAHLDKDSRGGRVVGVNAGHKNGMGGHTGISWFYKSTVILEILRKEGLA
ncbi:serine protease [Burkholderia cepacia]|uniref:S1 family peptidase n=1 Tax=Burkholderia cepacia TaxID=292 RepID=UPI002FDFC301